MEEGTHQCEHLNKRMLTLNWARPAWPRPELDSSYLGPVLVADWLASAKGA